MKVIFLFLVAVNTCILPSSKFPTADDVSAEFNKQPIVRSGDQVLSYHHDPVSDGIGVFQGETILVRQDTGKTKIVYAGSLASSQLIIVDDSQNGKLIVAYADNLFKPALCGKLLNGFNLSDTSESRVRVRIIINQQYFNNLAICAGTSCGSCSDEWFAQKFIGKFPGGITKTYQPCDGPFRDAYGCDINGRITQLSDAFAKHGIKPQIIKLVSSLDLSATLEKYLKHDAQYRDVPKELYQRLSYDVTSGVCINVETGALSWWSLPLARVYAANLGKVMNYYSERNAKLLQYQQTMQIMREERRREQWVQQFNQKLGVD